MKLPKQSRNTVFLEDIIFDEVSDWASIDGITWKLIRLQIGTEYGLSDIDNRPHQIYKPLFQKLYKVYRKGRKGYLNTKKAEEAFRKNYRSSFIKAVSGTNTVEPSLLKGG
jgi:hypothetical protein